MVYAGSFWQNPSAASLKTEKTEISILWENVSILVCSEFSYHLKCSTNFVFCAALHSQYMSWILLHPVLMFLLFFFCNRLFSLCMYLKCLNFNLNHSSSGRLLSSNTKNTVWLFYLLSHSNFLLIALPWIFVFFVYLSTSVLLDSPTVRLSSEY